MPDKFLEKIQNCCCLCRPDIGGHLCHHEVGGGAPHCQLYGMELHEVGGGDLGLRCKLKAL